MSEQMRKLRLLKTLRTLREFRFAPFLYTLITTQDSFSRVRSQTTALVCLKRCNNSKRAAPTRISSSKKMKWTTVGSPSNHKVEHGTWSAVVYSKAKRQTATFEDDGEWFKPSRNPFAQLRKSRSVTTGRNGLRKIEMAERGGFEPPVLFGHSRFPGVRVKPLCHLSDRQYIGLPSLLAQYFSKAIQASIVMWVNRWETLHQLFMG
jgi:hypothetical protein